MVFVVKQRTPLGVREMVSAPQTNGLPEGEDRLQSMYFERALNYHIAARYAVVARLAPVSGNLAHHAIEFYLKGALINELDQAARRKMSHKLLKLWRRYKRGRQNPALDKFDQTISDINKFERIRYPEARHVAFTGFVRNTTRKSGQEYDLALDEVDAG
jgi:HEPN domain-containing protein